MRVLYWTERFWPHIGGIEILSLELIQSLQSRGYEFKVVTSHSNTDLPDEVVYNDIPIHRFHFLTSLTVRNLEQLITARKNFAKLKQTFKPDLIHINFSGPSSYFHLQTAKVHPTPTLITVHSLPPSASENNPLLARTLRSASWVNTVSKMTLDTIRQLIPEIHSRSSVIYNALEMPSSQPEQLPFDSPRILCLARLVGWKGFDLALTAFSSLLEHFPDARLVIAGDGPERQTLEKQATELEVRDAVEFTGWVLPEKVPELINTATIVIIPSREGGGENLPTVAIQASQMARPILATRIAGLPEIVVHQKTGLLVEQDDSKALAEAMMSLLKHPEIAIKMGQEARKQARERFSLENFINAYDTLYRHLIGEYSKVCSN